MASGLVPAARLCQLGPHLQGQRLPGLVMLGLGVQEQDFMPAQGPLQGLDLQLGLRLPPAKPMRAQGPLRGLDLHLGLRLPPLKPMPILPAHQSFPDFPVAFIL